MREQTIQAVQELVNGLRPDYRVGRRGRYLTQALNVEVSAAGIGAPEEFINPFGGAVNFDWPFPQLFRGAEVTLLCTRDKVYYVDERTSPWTISLIANVPVGGVWQFADAGDGWYLFNGTTTVYRTGIFRQLEPPTDSRLFDGIFANSSFTIRSGTQHRGRIVVGGFKAADSISSGLAELMGELDLEMPEWNALTSSPLRGNWVAWSSIGGGDIPLWFLNSTIDTLLQVDKEGIIAKVKRNEMGFMPMSFQGDVLAVVPLNEHVVIYGEDGICTLTLAGGYYAFSKLLNQGIAGRGAVCNGGVGHVFVTTSGDLYFLSPKLGLRKLDYTEYIYPILDDGIVVTYDEIRGRFYISTSTEAFNLQLTSEGSILTRHSQYLPTLQETYTVPKGRVDNRAVITTDTINFGIAGLKTITAVGLGITSSARVNVYLDYRVKKGELWKRTEGVKVNQEGNAYIRASGIEFRIIVEGMDYQDFFLDVIDVSVQYDDKRFMRGVNAAVPAEP